MNIILDLVLIAIIVFCGWSGYRKGFILGISGILALIVAFYGAQLVADTYSQEFNSMLQPFVTGVVDKAVNEAKEELLSAAPEVSDENAGTDPSQGVAEGEDLDVFTVTYEALGKVGILKSAAKDMAEDLAQKVTSTGKALREELVKALCSKVAYVLTATIVFLMIIIIFTVLANLINLAFKLPGLEFINDILGSLFGVAKGLIFAFAIAWILRYTGFILKEEVIDETILLKWMMEHNLVTMFFGI